MKQVTLRDGESVPALGQGTWRMGEQSDRRGREVTALRLGIDLGMTLIDTAEMYGEGGAEEVVGEAIAGQRDRVFLVSKVYPHNASRAELPRACERSLKRLRVDAIDLYLLHWRGDIPLRETVEALERLRSGGKIRNWGVSNFDLDDMIELRSTSEGSVCAANQVLYNLEARGIEFDLLLEERQRKIAIMAYAPVGHGKGLLSQAALAQIAKRHEATPAQIALAWVLRQPGVIAIPKAVNERHVQENAQAIDIRLRANDLSELDRAFPPPHSKQPLAML
jgi:diketogulonate reductase-like aldo/keto reductase